jgi:hypothetical protein
MKKSQSKLVLSVLTLTVGILTVCAFVLRAQEMATPVQEGAISLTDTNLDWNSMSDLEVELKTIEMTTPTPAANAPDVGTFWSAQHAPGSPEAWPPLPGNINNSPVWDLGDGVFLLSDLDFDYNPPVTFSLKAHSGMMMDAMDSGPGGDGSDSGDGGISPTFAPNYGTNLWLSITGVSNSFANLFLENTEPDIQYEIQSKQDLTVTGWVSEGFVLGSELTNWTPMNVAQNGRTNLFFRIRSWADDGSGLPIWWQLQYFGTTGINPNALDSAGDGWTIYQKYQMGLNPNVFYTPPAPQGLTATYNASTGTANISWLPSPGAVTGYILTTPSGTVDLSASATSYADNDSSLAADLTANEFSFDNPTFQLEASYSGGNSANANASLAASSPNIWLVQGAQGSNYLAVSALPSGTAAIRLSREDEYAELGNDDYSYNASNDIPISSFTNGFYYIPPGLLTAPVDAYGNAGYVWWAQTVNTNGGANSQADYLGQTFDTNVNYGVDAANPLYADGRAQMKQNLIFQLRAAMVDNTFAYYVGDNNGFGFGVDLHEFIYPTNYAFSGFYQTFDQNGEQQATGSFDSFLPFENNYLYRNFVFNLSDVNQGFPTTGVWGGDVPYMYISNSVEYFFQPPTTSGTTISSLLSTNDARWLGAGTYLYGSTISDVDYSEINVSLDGSGNYHLSGSNYFGLPFVSVKIAYASGSGTATTTLNAGSSTTQGGYMYAEAAQPQFLTVAYDFWNPSPPYGTTPTPLPGTTGFSQTNGSDLFIVPVEGTIAVAGYAKLSLQNGYSGVYGYLGQYFDKAYQIDTNGVTTTNTTGVVSPYGNFFATQPGPTALVTMPDPDTGARGTCTVYAVSLALDRNHDGNMDTSFNGADATSANSPYIHWCNNNYDRFALDEDDGTNYQDDVLVQNCPYTPNTATPDCNYRDMFGNRVIPDTRDLEDYARLWVSGITSNLLAALPAGSTITLNWGDVGSPNSGNPTIDLFQATDADGGIEYLTNETSAANQIDPAQSAYVGRLAPGGSVQLNASFFSGWAGNHFIWCGVTNGSGQLNLTIADASGNVLVQASQWIQIVDIKQMYERWTVGDNLNNAPATTASLATENLPVDASAFQYSPPQDTNTPYILFVHGWNMESWEKDRFAETAFKRLYWQGYQGRFGEFRWPTGSGFTGDFSQIYNDPQEKDNFDNSEYNAWLSGAGLLNKLNDLNAEYSGHVYMLAHSMGNVVAGEALRLTDTNQVVNTYVASQAAVTAHTYDDTISDYSFEVPINVPGLGIVNVNFGPKTPNIYGDWFAGNNGGGAEHVISLYNTNDYALSQLHWQLDQLFKPDTLVAESGSLWNYGYSGSTNDPAPWNHFFKTNTVSTTVNFDIVGSLPNRYEVMAYAAQSYTTALGATPGVTNLASLNLPTIWPSPDPLDNNYASHFFHSAEFRGDSVWEWKYWNTLLFSSSFGFNISSP